jgi:UDP-3-O-[3-hydroxymyristoyl] glucosamine N-acyltransferase
MYSFFNQKDSLSLSEAATVCGAHIKGDPSLLISNFGPLDSKTPYTLSCFHNKKYRKALECTCVQAVILHPNDEKSAPESCALLIHEKPYRAYALLLKHFYKDKNPYAAGISPKASVHPSAVIDKTATVCDFACIEEGVIIGANTVIEPFACIKAFSNIGHHCHISSHVSLTHTHMGNHVLIKPGARIGQAGFGFDMDENGPIDVMQLGSVIIHDNVIVGSNTVIDRGAGPDTVIGKGVRIDSNVMIAHNVHIGDGSIIVAQTGISGSTKLGKFVVTAGQVGIAGHLTIGDGARIAAQSGVMRDIPEGQDMAGTPAVSARQWHKQTVVINAITQLKKETIKK